MSFQSMTQMSTAAAAVAAIMVGHQGLAVADTGPICWKFTQPGDADPFPTDRIKVRLVTGFKDGANAVVIGNNNSVAVASNGGAAVAGGGVAIAVAGKSGKEKLPAFDFGLVGTWTVEIAGGTVEPEDHVTVIPLHGALVHDLSGFRRLTLDGTLVDLNLSSPFIYECHIDATLDPVTLNSVDSATNAVDDRLGHAYAYCRSAISDGADFFPPENPFVSLLRLERIDCAGPSVSNP